MGLNMRGEKINGGRGVDIGVAVLRDVTQF